MRIKQLSQKLTAFCDAALVFSQENRFYLTGFPSSDGCLFVSGEKAVLFVDGRYYEAAQKSAEGCEVVLLGKLSEQLRDQLDELPGTAEKKKLAIESEKVTLAELRRYRKNMPFAKILTVDKLDSALKAQRIRKDAVEVDNILSAQRIAEAAFEYITGFIKIGMSEKDIATELDYYMLTHGAQAVSFETIVVSGVNSSLPHGVPSDKRVEKGDFITLDFGAVYKGYHSDMTRTLAIGKISEKQKKVYNIVLEAQKRCISQLIAGMKCMDADKAARDYIVENGFGEYFTHSTGHGVGIDIHEAPSLSKSSAETLCEGFVVTVEPGIYLPGEFGVRIEDMLYITDNSVKNLTSAPKELLII